MIEITIIGTGKVAQHLWHKCLETGLKVLEIVGRREKCPFDCSPTTYISNISDLNPHADFYIVALKDDALPEIAESLNKILSSQAIVAHTSGSVSSAVWQDCNFKGGVFYPLQTFSIGVPVNWNEVPICIYAPAQDTLAFLKKMATRLSPKVYEIDDFQRSYLHLSAVFANNFTNHLLTLSESILKEKNIDFDILKPLIKQTFEKAQIVSPRTAQTGPAIRGDEKTIQRHLELLRDNPKLAQIYGVLTRSIVGDVIVP